jgi:ATP/ADP translocase/CRP-like cAMP-binding protein/HEAT repeat protein
MSERPSLLARLLRPVVHLHEGEAFTALLMFLYSFLAMTSYNIIKPISKSEYISSLGADDVPYVNLAIGILIGFIMQGYTRAIALAPRRWMIPVTQVGIAGLLLLFWFLFTTVKADWVAVAFYIVVTILAILLISQFWTLANDVYDPRQAKRIFGFIGAGSSLGGATGAALTAFLVRAVGSRMMILMGAGVMVVCLAIVIAIVRREQKAGTSDASKTGEEETVSGGEALRMLRSSRHLQIISLVIAFGAIGSNLVDQQVNMAAAESLGAENGDAIAAFLGQLIVYLSLIGFVIQITLTSRIQAMGIGFALLVLPFSLAASATLILLNKALWAPSVGRILDTSFRYTVDKTSREVLFLPVPTDLKYRAKPFIDVTMDRFAKGASAVVLLVCIKEWGLGLDWQQLSYLTVILVAVWAVLSVAARREYMKSFRRSIEQQSVVPGELRLTNPDPAAVEALVSELAHPEPKRVLYAIDLLDAMDKRHLVTPLLLSHESSEIRVRTLRVAEASGPALADRWLPGVERSLKDPDSSVRVAAVSALAGLRGGAAADVMRPFIDKGDPALAIAAGAALAGSSHPDDVALADDTLRHYSSDTREQAVPWRLQVARALGDVKNPSFRPLLVPLMYDTNLDVARAAITSAGSLGAHDFLFVPPLVSLLRNRRLKAAARSVLVGYGEAVVAPLAYFLQDRDEDKWIRRHVPSTLASLPYPVSIATLVAALDDTDGFVRFKAVAALDRLRRAHPELAIDGDAVTRHVNAEAARAFNALTLHHNLFVAGGLDQGCLLAQALTEKHQRALGRTLTLLGLVHHQADVAVVRHALQQPDAHRRSRAVEYLDNLLEGAVRKRVMLLIEEMPAAERIRRGNSLYRTRTRDVEDTLAQLLHDEDESIASAAIHLVEARGLWSLAGDIEHILEHRDVRDQHVFEAASWALAAYRLQADRRQQLWQEALPAVEVADRLRRVPLFDFTDVHELFRLARLGRQVRYDKARPIYERGGAVTTVYFLLEGTVTLKGGSGAHDLTAPAALGVEELLEGAPSRSTTVAAARSVTLELTADEFLSLLSENVELAEGLFRMLIVSRGLATGHSLVRGNLAPGLQPQARAAAQAVDRMILLQASPLLAHATAAQLWRLSAIAQPMTAAAGRELLAQGSEASILIVLEGTVSLASNGSTETAGAGDIIGMYETLAGTAIDATVTATGDVQLLRLDRGALFELLADHTDLLQGIFSALSSRAGSAG